MWTAEKWALNEFTISVDVIICVCLCVCLCVCVCVWAHSARRMCVADMWNALIMKLRHSKEGGILFENENDCCFYSVLVCEMTWSLTDWKVTKWFVQMDRSPLLFRLFVACGIEMRCSPNLLTFSNGRLWCTHSTCCSHFLDLILFFSSFPRDFCGCGWPLPVA